MEFKNLTVAAVVFVFLAACTARRGENEQAAGERAAAPTKPVKNAVMPPAGPSWLQHLGLTLSQTHMGQMGGTGKIPATRRREPEMEASEGLRSGMQKFLPLWRSASPQAFQVLNETFVLAGADLYRFNCRSCHGADGKGSPPEINSLIGPVQGASRVMIQRRMKSKGIEISDEMTEEMAAEAGKTLRDRLHNGGQAMPAFNRLREDEVTALLAYLDRLAGVPAGNHPVALVSESAARVGEHIIKGTCQVCHDAIGPGAGHRSMMRGLIPSLASMPEEHSLSSFTLQVANGSSGMMMMMGWPRMPAFPYFTEEEIAAAYFYIEGYPPKP